MTYSFVKNLSYMGMVFSRPRRLLSGLLNETSLWYGIVPAAISEILYVILGWWNYFTQPQLGWSLNPVARAFELSKRQMSFIQAAAHPLAGVVDVFLFAAIVYGAARLLGASSLYLRAWLMGYLFLWGTFSCLAVMVDLAISHPPFDWNLKNLMYVHHLAALVTIAYLLEFIHRKGAVDRWKSAVITISGYIVVLVSRVVFIP